MSDLSSFADWEAHNRPLAEEEISQEAQRGREMEVRGLEMDSSNDERGFESEEGDEKGGNLGYGVREVFELEEGDGLPGGVGDGVEVEEEEEEEGGGKMSCNWSLIRWGWLVGGMKGWWGVVLRLRKVKVRDGALRWTWTWIWRGDWRVKWYVFIYGTVFLVR